MFIGIASHNQSRQRPHRTYPLYNPCSNQGVPVRKRCLMWLVSRDKSRIQPRQARNYCARHLALRDTGYEAAWPVPRTFVPEIRACPKENS